MCLDGNVSVESIINTLYIFVDEYEPTWYWYNMVWFFLWCHYLHVEFYSAMEFSLNMQKDNQLEK